MSLSYGLSGDPKNNCCRREKSKWKTGGCNVSRSWVNGSAISRFEMWFNDIWADVGRLTKELMSCNVTLSFTSTTHFSFNKWNFKKLMLNSVTLIILWPKICAFLRLRISIFIGVIYHLHHFKNYFGRKIYKFYSTC